MPGATFPNWKRIRGLIRFSLDLMFNLRQYKNITVIYKISFIFDNLTQV